MKQAGHNHFVSGKDNSLAKTYLCGRDIDSGSRNCDKVRYIFLEKQSSRKQ